MKSTARLTSPRSTQIALAIGSAFLSSVTQAQNTEAVTTLPTVIVTADRDAGYTRSTASSATKIDTPLRELPVSLHVVTDDLIRDLAIVSPGELANLVPSVQKNSSGYGSSGNQDFTIRGFRTDGVNYRNGYRSSDRYTTRDMANVERVDFVMGPSSATYGNASPAGAVNTITKTPFFGNANSVTFSVGSWSSVRGTGDFNWSSDDLAVRLNIASDKANSFIDYEKPKNTLIAPSFLYRLGNGTEVMYAMEYFKTRIDGLSNGLPPIDGVFDLRKGATTGQPWTQLNNESLSHRVEFKSKLGEDWTFRQGIYSERTKQDVRSISPYEPGETILSDFDLFYNAYSKNKYANDVAQSEFIGKTDFAGLKHKIVLGYEYAKSRFTANYFDVDPYTPGTFGAPNPVMPSFTEGSLDQMPTSRTNAIYVNDQFKLGSLHVLLGLRNDWIYTSSLTKSQRNSALSTRVGFLYPLTNQTSVYYSSGQSFVPNLGTSVSGGVLDPEKGKQNEIGIKHSVTPKLDATFAVFDIVKSNVMRSNLANPARYYLDGEQKSRGIEATLNGRLTSSLKLIANLSHLNYAKITAGVNAGDSLFGAAKNSINVWGIQNINSVLPGALSVGLGVARVSDRLAADSNNSGLKLPSYTKFDAGVFYKHQKTRFALNIKNLNDAKVFGTAMGAWVTREAPRSVLASVEMDF